LTGCKSKGGKELTSGGALWHRTQETEAEKAKMLMGEITWGAKLEARGRNEESVCGANFSRITPLGQSRGMGNQMEGGGGEEF